MYFESYHLAWLKAHPYRSAEWLADRLADGFHVHHMDGDHANDAPSNLILLEGGDHMRLHGGGFNPSTMLPRNSDARLVEGKSAYDLRASGLSWYEVASAYDLNTSRETYVRKAKSYAAANDLPWPPMWSEEVARLYAERRVVIRLASRERQKARTRARKAEKLGQRGVDLRKNPQ